MMRNGRRAKAILSCALIGAVGLTLVGCTTYYQVTDTNSGKVYYTTKVSKAKASGAVTFKDARSGANVTVPASEYHEISEITYNAGVAGGERTAPAPAPAPAED